MSYNGWTNRNTWLVNVWYGDMFHDMAQEGIILDSAYIESFVTELIEEQTQNLDGFVKDLIDFSGINWDELADSYMPKEESED